MQVINVALPSLDSITQHLQTEKTVGFRPQRQRVHNAAEKSDPLASGVRTPHSAIYQSLRSPVLILLPFSKTAVSEPQLDNRLERASVVSLQASVPLWMVLIGIVITALITLISVAYVFHRRVGDMEKTILSRVDCSCHG